MTAITKRLPWKGRWQHGVLTEGCPPVGEGDTPSLAIPLPFQGRRWS